MSSPDGTGFSEHDGDLTREEAGAHFVTVTRAELARMVDSAQQCVMGEVLADWQRERQRHFALMKRALVRLCEQGDSATSSALVRELRDTIGH